MSGSGLVGFSASHTQWTTHKSHAMELMHTGRQSLEANIGMITSDAGHSVPHACCG